MAITFKRLLLVAAALAAVTFAAVQFAPGSGGTALATDPPGTDADFSLDVDTSTVGIQTSRMVPIGSSFNVEVSTNTTNALPWEAYQITLDYDDVVLDGIGNASGWTQVPSDGVNPGQVFPFDTGAFCTPATTSGSVFNEDDAGLAQWAMTCTENTSGTDHTGEGALAQFTFTCEAAGTSNFDLRDVNDTFLLDSAFSQFNEHVHNGSVECVPPPSPTNTFTPAPPTNTFTPTNTATNTNTPIPTATSAFESATMNKEPLGPAINNVPGELPLANLFLCENGPCDQPNENQVMFMEVGDSPVSPLGAFEFQIKFDHKIFDISLECVTEASPNPSCDAADAASWDIQLSDQLLSGLDNRNWSMDQCFRNVTENYINFACVSQGGPNDGYIGVIDLAKVTVHPDEDLKFRLRPGNDNGIVRVILDENCELVDPLGHPVVGSIAGGLTTTCGDIAITVRILEGDLDLDCDVDVADAQAIAQLYGMVFGLFLYDPWYDLEPNITDFDIDAKDLQKVFGRIGSDCQLPVPPQPPIAPPQA